MGVVSLSDVWSLYCPGRLFAFLLVFDVKSDVGALSADMLMELLQLVLYMLPNDKSVINASEPEMGRVELPARCFPLGTPCTN